MIVLNIWRIGPDWDKRVQVRIIWKITSEDIPERKTALMKQGEADARHATQWLAALSHKKARPSCHSGAFDSLSYSNQDMHAHQEDNNTSEGDLKSTETSCYDSNSEIHSPQKDDNGIEEDSYKSEGDSESTEKEWPSRLQQSRSSTTIYNKYKRMDDSASEDYNSTLGKLLQLKKKVSFNLPNHKQGKNPTTATPSHSQSHARLSLHQKASESQQESGPSRGNNNDSQRQGTTTSKSSESRMRDGYSHQDMVCHGTVAYSYWLSD